MINFIFMLTHSDSTIEDALDYVDALSDTGLHYIGFKDVGATPERQRSIAHAARDAGFETMLEEMCIRDRARRDARRGKSPGS